MNNNVPKKNNKLDAHRTRGSVLDELNMGPQDRLELNLKADLHQDILKLIKKKRFTPRQLEKLFDDKHGKSFKNGNGEHCPAIEVHRSNRFFTVTGEVISPSSALREISTMEIRN